MTLANLNSFLKFGFFLDYSSDSIDLNVDLMDLKGKSEEELIELGINFYRKAITGLFKENEDYLVPISGGLDSRGILAALLEHTNASNISTITYGSPGSYDYEIGNSICKLFGTIHHSYDLTKCKYSIDELLDTSRRINHQTVLFHHPPVWKLDDSYHGYKIWSGVSIESWFGSHISSTGGIGKTQAVQQFYKENKYVRSMNLTHPDVTDYEELIENEWNDQIELEIKIDILNRQKKYILPHVLIEGFDYNVLFSDKNLTNFALSLPRNYLINRYLYHEILRNSFSVIQSFPCKNNYGLPLNASRLSVFKRKVEKKILSHFTRFSNPNVNYINFNDGIRYRDDLRSIIYQSIMDLHKRKLVDWVDMNAIWQNHINRGQNHADALITLASLEIHLKAGLKL